ncbi:DegT/DnrJ/EryC1/StrS family aminotransferase [Shimia sp. SDUM112013]|uniref:DegT/DnrJ/EryC1/StrS family aminotransferase n=1 Tax=Shimia sp. SDUM112013 TaxID=3136160 RepID=UPI0032EFCEEE
MPVPFFRPDLSEDAVNTVADVLRSGWLTSGPQCAAFEAEFASYVGGETHAVTVNSATAGLHLALEAVGVGPGDEVIVPTLTFTATAEVAAYLGARVVLVDMDPNTLGADLDKVTAALSPRTKAVMFVHFGGYPVDLTDLAETCAARGIPLIEDAAHAIPSRIGPKHIGSFASDVAVFSFYANKTMTTGEGGMVVTRDTAVAARIRTMRTHGIDRDSFARFTTRNDQWRYDVIEAGFKYNMTDFAAALGRHQLAHVDAMRLGRTRAAGWYDAALQGLPLDLPPRPSSEDTHSWHIYPVRLHGGLEARRQVTELFAARQIGYSVHYTPLHKLTYWSGAAILAHEGYPAADAYFEGCLTLPLFPTMSRAEVDEVVGALKEALAC